MFKVLLLFATIVSAVVVNSLRITGEEIKVVVVKDVINTTTTTATTVRPKDIEICTELSPEFVSTRNGRYQTLECVARICNDDDIDDDVVNGVTFRDPLFEWTCDLGRIAVSNGTCDYKRDYCWQTIDLDLMSVSHSMEDNEISAIQLSCSVTDAFVRGNTVIVTTGTDSSYLKHFRGKGIDQSCDTDSQCGDNMICIDSGRNSDARDGEGLCQCTTDFQTGVSYVRVMDQTFGEWLCAPPLMINESCVYDIQCQAMDPNSVCALTFNDGIELSARKCQCDEDMVYYRSSCKHSSDVTIKNTIIWWIFDGYNDTVDSTARRYWWLRTGAYIMAFLAIVVPILLLSFALIGLCCRRMTRRRSPVTLPPNMIPVAMAAAKPKFPAPRILINDLMVKKDKSDDKYNLVKNDHLIFA